MDFMPISGRRAAPHARRVRWQPIPIVIMLRNSDEKAGIWHGSGKSRREGIIVASQACGGQHLGLHGSFSRRSASSRHLTVGAIVAYHLFSRRVAVRKKIVHPLVYQNICLYLQYEI